MDSREFLSPSDQGLIQQEFIGELEEEKKIVNEASTVDVFTMYFKEVNHHGLIDSDQEVLLFKTLRDTEKELGVKMAHLKKVDANQDKRHYKEKCCDLEKKIDDLKCKIVVANLRLVVSVAKRYQNKYISLIDLINEGNIGLLEAVEKYDYHKGNKFSTYALYWIKQAITKALSDKARLIRIPNYLNNMLSKINEYIETCKKTTGREPPMADISGKFQIPVRKLRQILNLNKEINYLEEPVQVDSQAVFGDYVASDSLEDEIETDMAKKNLEKLIQNALGFLTPRERLVMELRYGLRGNRSYTLEEAGKLLSLTRERIRQIQNKGIFKMRQSIFSKEFEDIVCRLE